MNLSRYTYKDSGIEWLGEVPKHWRLVKIGRVCKLQGGYAFDSSLYGDEGAYLIQMSNLKSGSIELDENRKVPVDAIPAGFFLKPNDLLYGMSGSIGNYAIVPDTNEVLALNQRVGRFHSYHDLLERYLLYFIQSDAFDTQVRLMMTGTAQFNISSIQIHRVDIALPDVREQKAIAAFLDRETARIDALIEKKEKLIELLKEKRTALITHAVTKGLDPNAPMKDSGIEWLGEVPEQWEINRIGYSCYVKGRVGWQNLTTDEFVDEGPFCITGTDFVDGKIDWSKCYHVSEERYSLDPYIQLKNGDLLITKDGSIGKTALVLDLQGSATLNSGIFLVRPLGESFISSYLYWVLNSSLFDEFIELTKAGSTIAHLYQNVFVRFCLPQPNLPDQERISDFLDLLTSRIDKAIYMVKSSIDYLVEYRASLINAAVTGKIDVRNQV